MKNKFGEYLAQSLLNDGRPQATSAVRTELKPGYYIGIVGTAQIESGPYPQPPKHLDVGQQIYRQTTTGSFVPDPIHGNR